MARFGFILAHCETGRERPHNGIKCSAPVIGHARADAGERGHSIPREHP